LTRQKTWTSPVLSAGTHTVRFEHASGAVTDVDGIRIIDAPTYDDPDTAWTYTGAWATYNGSGPYNNTLHYSAALEDYATFTFEGSKFSLTYTKNAYRGNLDVYIDDDMVYTLNEYSYTTMWQQTWTSSTLSDGVHTVKFEHASGTYVDIDAIQIFGPP